MDSLRDLISIAVFTVFAALFIKMLLNVIKNVIGGSKTSAVTVAARVKEKKPCAGSGRPEVAGAPNDKTVCTVVFETLEGEALEFSVLSAEYDALSEGAVGHLTYSRNGFCSFAEDSLLKDGESI